MKEFFENLLGTVLEWLLTHGIKIVLIIIFAIIVNRIFKKIIEKTVRIAVKSDKYTSAESEQKRENTLITVFYNTSRVTIYTLTSFIVLKEIGIDIAPLLAGAGIVGLALGFGGQYLIRDVISGLFIIFENQYRVGDIVDLDGTDGFVEDISLRMTTLRDVDGTVHHVQHGYITRVSNLSKEFHRANIIVGVSYNTNLDHVIRVINEVGNDLANDPAWKNKIIKPLQFLRVDDFADSSINLRILGDTQATSKWEVGGEFRKRLKEAFDREGIEIPFPQVVMHKKNS